MPPISVSTPVMLMQPPSVSSAAVLRSDAGSVESKKLAEWTTAMGNFWGLYFMRAESVDIDFNKSKSNPYCIWQLITMFFMVKSVRTAGMPVRSASIAQNMCAM